MIPWQCISWLQVMAVMNSTDSGTRALAQWSVCTPWTKKCCLVTQRPCIVQILDRAKLWKEGMMDQIKREITIMKDLRERQAIS